MQIVPELPGILVQHNSEQEKWLRQHVARLCQLDHDRFPGGQPVSFGAKDIEKLLNYDYWVAEKSDGIRVLFLIVTDIESRDQSCYLIDRHNTYRALNGIYIPHHENHMYPLKNTLVDGELVVDVDPRTKQETLRFLVFDCLVADGQNVMLRTLDKRYGRLKEWFYKPYSKMMRDHPHMAAGQPFDIKVKETNFSYHVDKVFAVDIPALQHGNDGLIYTCVSTPYTPGTDPNIMKWKPPSENSIDFKLVLRFPPSRAVPSQPDFCAKPVFALHAWTGGAKYKPYDEMFVEDEEWERLKLSGEQLDDRIVEVRWDMATLKWRMMRFRDDKPNGNHIDVVGNVIQSIAEGVEKDALLAQSNAIRNAWKARQAASGGPPPSSASQPPHPHMRHPHHHPPPPQHLHHHPMQQQQQQNWPPVNRHPTPLADLRFGPLQTSKWSRVAGPEVVFGMRR